MSGVPRARALPSREVPEPELPPNPLDDARCPRGRSTSPTSSEVQDVPGAATPPLPGWYQMSLGRDYSPPSLWRCQMSPGQSTHPREVPDVPGVGALTHPQGGARCPRGRSTSPPRVVPDVSIVGALPKMKEPNNTRFSGQLNSHTLSDLSWVSSTRERERVFNFFSYIPWFRSMAPFISNVK